MTGEHPSSVVTEAAIDTRGHYRALDLYRFLAAFAVMLFHYSDFVKLEPLGNVRHLVDFFFMLSGFVLMNTYCKLNLRADLGSYLSKRLARIYPLQVATLVFFIGYSLLRARMTGVVGPQYPPSAILPNLLLLHAWGTTSATTFNQPSWSISAEWFVYLAFPVILLGCRRAGSWAILLAGVAMVVALSAHDAVFGGQKWLYWTYNGGAVRALPSFIIGVAINALPRVRASWAWSYALLAAIGAALWLPVPGEVFLALSAALIVVTAGAHGASWMTSPRIAILGSISYGVYMLHMCVAAFMFGIIGRYVPRHLHLELAGVAVGTTLVLAVASFHFFEMPARNWIRRLTSRQQSAAVN